MMHKEVFIKDVMYNAHPDCTSTTRSASELFDAPVGVVYGRGIINGVVSTIMAIQGCTFKSALEQVKRLAPNTDINALPECWRDDWKGVDV